MKTRPPIQIISSVTRLNFNVNKRLKVRLETLEIVYMLGRLFSYSHCSLTNWKNKSPGKFFKLLPFNHLTI